MLPFFVDYSGLIVIIMKTDCHLQIPFQGFGKKKKNTYHVNLNSWHFLFENDAICCNSAF